MEQLRICIQKIIIEISKGHMKNNALYISFNKSDNEVIFPDGISNEEVVTIVLQNQFWDLSIDDHGFEVVLDFFGERHNIYIPFHSIILIVDPVSHFYIDLRDFYKEEDVESKHEESNEESNLIEIDLG